MDRAELENRFRAHGVNDGTKKDLEDIRRLCGGLASYINDIVLEGREKETAVDRLEEVMFWANAGIARKGI